MPNELTKIAANEREFDEIFDSLEPCLRDHLISMDSILRKITSEASVCGVKPHILQAKLEERFWSLFQQVAMREAKGNENPAATFKSRRQPRTARNGA